METTSLITVEFMAVRKNVAAESRMNRGCFACGETWEASALPLSYTRDRHILRAF
jgi:hypothetical protein